MTNATPAGDMASYPCVVMRGGTSRAVFLKEADLPSDRSERERVILAIFGSPDRRQIDGIAGADPLTSKVAIIGPAPGPDTHLTYTFGQVEIERPEIDWHSLCGNISAAVGVFAVEEGLAPAVEPISVVRVHNTNLDRVLTIEVPVVNGRPRVRGDHVVPGVPGSGAPVLIDFADTAGGATGRLMPTGQAVDRLDVPGHGAFDVSLVDIGNAHVFVRAADLGLTGTESPAMIDADPALRAKLEAIRGAAAHRMGMIADPSRSAADSPATPLLGLVGRPQNYRADLTGAAVAADDVDLVCRLMFMQQAHKTYAGTSTVCTGVASRLQGTIVHTLARQTGGTTVRIGHPAGVIETETIVERVGDDLVVRRATLGRTARRIMAGQAYVVAPDPVAA